LRSGSAGDKGEGIADLRCAARRAERACGGLVAVVARGAGPAGHRTARWGHGRLDDVRSTHGRGFSALGPRQGAPTSRPARPPLPPRRGPLDRRDRLPARPRASHGEGLPVRPRRREGTRGQRAPSRRVPRLRRGDYRPHTARATPTSTARPATPARSKHGGRANWCATRCAPGASAPAPRRPSMTGLAPTRDAAVMSRLPAWPMASGPLPAPSPTSPERGGHTRRGRRGRKLVVTSTALAFAPVPLSQGPSRSALLDMESFDDTDPEGFRPHRPSPAAARAKRRSLRPRRDQRQAPAGRGMDRYRPEGAAGSAPCVLFAETVLIVEKPCTSFDCKRRPSSRQRSRHSRASVGSQPGL
jgi:hypothetical protein